MKSVPPPDPPLPNTYWVLPGRFLAGEHPLGADEADTRGRIERLNVAGLSQFLDLTHEYELPDYRRWLPRGARHVRSAIPDTEVPESAAQMREIQSHLRTTLAAGSGLYLHCRAGIGRTGTVVGCFLVEQGLDGNAALKELNRLWKQSARSQSWKTVPQTPQQAEYIRRWSPSGQAPIAAVRSAGWRWPLSRS
jgi:Protein-tyrosine phosphatase